MKTQEKKDTKERRSLLAGLTSSEIPRSVEEAFVYAKPLPPEESPPPTIAPVPVAQASGEERGHSTQSMSRREPLTTRIRSDFAKALKRASLERQLAGQYPNSMLAILEEALEPWLRKNGYLD